MKRLLLDSLMESSAPLKKFSKYHGLGNDFIIIDQREFPFRGDVVSLCDRQKGIGADGVILLEASQRADLKMRIFNRDGAEAEMCGNGLRCFLHFAKNQGLSISLVETMQRLHQVREDWSKVNAGSLSRFILWGDSKNLTKNLLNYLQRFNISDPE